jgi:subtilisin family serine protease
MRKIVVFQGSELFEAAYHAQNFALIQQSLPVVGQLPLVNFLSEYPPTRIPFGEGISAGADPRDFEGSQGHLFTVSVDVPEEAEADADAQLYQAFGPEIQIYRDPEINLAAGVTVSPTGPVGDLADVAAALNLSNLTANGHQGLGVRIAVIDTGIDGTRVNVSGGWSPYPGIYPGGGAPQSHGTMCALDALIAAPQVQIRDYPLLRYIGGAWVGFLSDAIRFSAQLMTEILQQPGPMVVSNSWCLFDRNQDAPVGHPQNYSQNPAHPFNTITGALIAAGADVVFAAGNCGQPGPDGRCGANDTGPGNSIHGANSHPNAVTVAAVTVRDDRLCYSSQGPGGLAPTKPDLCGFSHFGYPNVTGWLHPGTSAACPVVAGVIAALRSKPTARNLAPSSIKQALIKTARPVAGPGFTTDFGHGVVDASAAWSQV